ARTFTLAAWRRLRCVSTEAGMVNQHIRDSARAEHMGEQHDVLALGDRLFHDSQELWPLYPDPATKHWPRFRRKEAPGSPDHPARLVKALESAVTGCRWLLARWNELREKNLPGKSWTAYDKLKAIRLMGKQPLDVLSDPPGDMLMVFLACHEIDPKNKSP